MTGRLHFASFMPRLTILAPEDTFYTRDVLHQRRFTPETFYTRQLLHQRGFTPDTFYTKQLLHQTALLLHQPRNSKKGELFFSTIPGTINRNLYEMLIASASSFRQAPPKICILPRFERPMLTFCVKGCSVDVKISSMES